MAAKGSGGPVTESQIEALRAQNGDKIAKLHESGAGLNILVYMQLQVDMLIEHGFNPARRLQVNFAIQKELGRALDAAVAANEQASTRLHLPA